MPKKDTPIVPGEGQVHRKTGWLLAAVCVAAVTIPALMQVALEATGWFNTVDPKTGGVQVDRDIQVLALITNLPRTRFFTGRPKSPTLLKHIQDFESALEERSILSSLTQPWTQYLQMKLLHQGNEKVVLGRDGWMFYADDISTVVGKGFLGRRAVRPNEEAKAVNPLPFILKFHEDLRARGIQLVLAPVPVKASIYPERLASYDARMGPPVNASLHTFYQELRQNGVTVIDLTDDLWQARTSGEPLWLPLDSHWSPAGMNFFAKRLAERLLKEAPCLQQPNPDAGEYETRPRQVTNRGDVFDMLKLPPGKAHLFAPATVTIRQVRDATADRWLECDESSSIVLLGDSAANIFSVARNDRNWGEHAGLPEHLALNLHRPIHWIAVDGGGPSLTRQQLAEDGLDGKKIVVWEIIVRDFTHPITKWEHVELPPVGAVRSVSTGAVETLEVEAVIQKTTQPPLPDRQELYPDTKIYTLLEVKKVLSGRYPGKDLVIVEWAQRNKKFLEPFDYREGDKLHLTLVPLKEARRSDPSIRSTKSVNDIKRPDLTPYWVTGRK